MAYYVVVHCGDCGMVVWRVFRVFHLQPDCSQDAKQKPPLKRQRPLLATVHVLATSRSINGIYYRSAKNALVGELGDR